MNISFTLTNIIHRPNYFVTQEIMFINGSCDILFSMSLFSVSEMMPWLRPAFKARKCEMPKIFFVILSV